MTARRKPTEIHPRITPLPNLPLFYKIRGKNAVVVGMSEAARWKAELLTAAGAHVVQLDDGWTAPHLEGVALAVADLPDRREAERFAQAAHAAGALVNITDQPEFGDVQFGSIVNRAPLVIAISTDGAAPMLGQSIRARIEAVLPPGLSDWATVARTWRKNLKRRIGDFSERRRFWERFVETAWRNPNRCPPDEDFDALIDQSRNARGRVTLVGAGPGDAELLTLRAVRALQSATVILYDDLVGPDALELARREARRIVVGKRGHGPSCDQSEINERMVKLALSGENVVRLKGGDPLIFGRATDEIAACRAAGVEVSIVPGISAAQGAAASLLLSLTERNQARRVQFITGHGADGELPGDIDWTAIADPKATTAVYMPRKTLGAFVRTAVAMGLDPTTPAVAVASATLPNHRHVAAAIGELETLAAELPPGAPVTVIIGWVARELVAGAARILPFMRIAS